MSHIIRPKMAIIRRHRGQYNMQMSISYLKRYEIYFMGSKIDVFYPLGPKAKIGEIHSLV